MILINKICTVKIKSKKKSVESFSTEEGLKRLGERIKQLRLKKGYTSYEQFAYEHNISRAQFGRYERGEDLRFSSLLKILHALNISLEEFFGEGFNP